MQPPNCATLAFGRLSTIMIASKDEDERHEDTNNCGADADIGSFTAGGDRAGTEPAAQ